jgi:hypothetical protein
MYVNKYFVINSQDFIHVVFISLKPLPNTWIYIYSEHQENEAQYGFMWLNLKFNVRI